MHSTADAPSEPDQPVRIPPELLALLGLLAALGPFSIDTYLPSLPALAADLGTTADRAQATLSAYFVGLAAGQLVLGPVSDRFGRRAPLVGGLLLYVLASGLCALAPSIGWLWAGRALQAFGACTGLIASRAVLRDLYSPRDMARALSLIMLVMGLAPIIAPIAGSAVAAWLGWRAIFVGLAVYGVFALLLTGRRLPETLPSDAREDLDPARILRTYGSLLVEPVFLANTLVGGFVQAGLFAYIASSSFVFIEVYGLGSTAFAMLFGINAIGLILGSQVNARLLRTQRPSTVLRGALALYVLSTTVLLGVVLSGLSSVVAVALPLWFAVSSLGFCFPNATALAMEPAGKKAGSAAALLGTLQYGLAGLSSYASGLLYTGDASGMATMMFLCGALAAVTLAVAPLLRPRHEGVAKGRA